MGLHTEDTVVMALPMGDMVDIIEWECMGEETCLDCLEMVLQ